MIDLVSPEGTVDAGGAGGSLAPPTHESISSGSSSVVVCKTASRAPKLDSSEGTADASGADGLLALPTHESIYISSGGSSVAVYPGSSKENLCPKCSVWTYLSIYPSIYLTLRYSTTQPPAMHNLASQSGIALLRSTPCICWQQRGAGTILGALVCGQPPSPESALAVAHPPVAAACSHSHGCPDEGATMLSATSAHHTRDTCLWCGGLRARVKA